MTLFYTFYKLCTRTFVVKVKDLISSTIQSFKTFLCSKKSLNKYIMSKNNQKKLESTVSCILHVCFQVSFGMATGLVSVVLNVQQLIKLCLGD